MEKKEILRIISDTKERIGKDNFSYLKMRLISALGRTTEIPIGNTNYLDATLMQRLGGIAGAGSWFEDMTEEELLKALILPENELTEFTPDCAVNGCTYYSINIPGKNGIADIADLPKNSPLYLTIAHAGTGRFDVVTSAKVDAKDEAQTTIILGNEDGVGEVMYTLHPGLPVRPSDITLDVLVEKLPKLKNIIEQKSIELRANGQERESVVLQIDREMASILDFDKAKIISNEMAKKFAEQAIDIRRKDEIDL